MKTKTKEVTISVTPTCFTPTFKMIIDIPDTEDEKEYIDDLLESFISEEYLSNLEWDFA